MVLSTVCCSGAGKNPSEVSSLAHEYSRKDGFEVISVGKILLNALGAAARIEADEEDRAALDAFKGIRKLTVVDFEDASGPDKASFCNRVDKLLQGMELILEAKDSGDVVKIYGRDDGSKLHDIIIYCPEEALICVNGSIAMEDIGRLMEVAQ